jgi:ubiquinone/menaquinone biosynthesis C-methylase UbiE
MLRRVTRYGDFWKPADELQAMQLVLNETDAELFETSGRQQATNLLCPMIEPSDIVLDLGCGIGRVARYVTECCRVLWAVDASESMLALARERLADRSNVRFALCEGTTIPELADNSVDFAYSILTLQHLEREDAFRLLMELRRVMRPNAKAFLTFPNLLSDEYLSSFLQYVEAGDVSNPVRARFYTPEEVRRLVPVAGFDIQSFVAGVEIEVTCIAAERVLR